MDFKKMFLSGIKFFAVTFVSVLAAALALAQGFQGDDPLQIVTMKFLVAPLLAGIIGICQNYLKHKND